MHRRIRTSIFFLFFTIFIIGAPMIVLYTAGYRLNVNTWRIQRTGVIAISTIPRGATVTINTAPTTNKTPYVAQRLTPGEYTVLLEKSGYQPWNQSITVNSGSTTYLTALLFAQATPELLLEEQAVSVTGDNSGRFIYLLVDRSLAEGGGRSVWRYDTVTRLQRKLADDVGNAITHITLNNDESTLLLTTDDNTQNTLAINTDTGITLNEIEAANAKNALPEYSFFDNGSNVEMRLVDTNTLVSLLPPSTYTVMFRNTTIALIKDGRDRGYLIDLNTQSVTQIDLPTALLSQSPSENLLAASDGNEIDVYNPQTGERTLITRQSDPILALHWHASNRALIFATSTKILAIEREKYETRETTTLVSDATIVNVWPEANSKNLTFFGTVHGITGIWKLALAQ